MHANPCRGQKRVTELLELDVQAVVTHPLWMLKIKPRPMQLKLEFSGRAGRLWSSQLNDEKCLLRGHHLVFYKLIK